MRRRALCLILLLGLVLNAADGLAKGLIDSGIYVDVLFTPYWVNNDQLFFRGFDRPKPADTVESKQLRHALYLWTVGDRPQVHARDRWAGTASPAWHCAADGEVWFAVHPDSDHSPRRVTQQLVGPPGRETLRPFNPWGREAPVPVHSSLGNCDRDYPPSLTGRVWAVDTFKDSYIDFGERNPAKKPLTPPSQIV
jgi:hypothetical protein